MLELFTTFNPVTIIIVVIMVCIALKKTDDWFHWIKQARDESYEKDRAIKQSVECLEQHKALAEEVHQMSQQFKGDEYFNQLKDTLTIMKDNIQANTEISQRHEAMFFEKYDGIQEQLHEITDKLSELKEDLTELKASDLDDIKGFIIDAHEKFMALGYIDDQHLEVLDRRYRHYKAEGGNTYVDRLMSDLMALPLKSTKAVTEWKAQGGH